MNSPLHSALTSLSHDLMHPTPRFLYQFTVDIARDVNETDTRVEDGKTITETKKVARSVRVPFGLKIPSRMEREDIDVERSVWWSRYVEKGILPTALINKVYANNGGILDNVDQLVLNEYQARFMAAETTLKRLEIDPVANKDALTAARLEFMKTRNEILRIQSDNAVFFQNTAEAKARQKVIEWVLLHLTYYRPIKDDGTEGDWMHFFEGETTEAKLAHFDTLVERNDVMWDKARDVLEFLATFCADGGVADPVKIADYLGTLEAEKAALAEAAVKGVPEPGAQIAAT